MATLAPTLHPVGEPKTLGRDSAVPARNDSRPNPNQVRERAYLIYQARCNNGSPGDAQSDWLQAERECRSLPSGGARPGTTRPGIDSIAERRLA